MKVFVDTDSDIRLSRRLNRDIRHRGRDLASVLEQVVNRVLQSKIMAKSIFDKPDNFCSQYSRHVKPAFDHYIAPTMAHADIIVPRGGENEVHSVNLNL